VNKLPFYGRVALNANDKPSLSIKGRIKRPMVWYGIDTDLNETDYVAKNVSINAGGTTYDLFFQGEKLTTIKTPMWGVHNVSNSLAAIAMSHQAGIELELIKSGLTKFQGVGRRLEKLFEKNNFLVIDDYGHHPTEVKATISTLRNVDKRPMCVVFEPHRFSRTQNFWKEFQECFEGATELFLTPIYAASEQPIPGITTEALVAEMKKSGKNVSYLPSLEDMKSLLQERKDKDYLFVTLGAGAISKKIREMIKSLA
jgi:UDP-N-acetylmuramate--alanine ligase